LGKDKMKKMLFTILMIAVMAIMGLIAFLYAFSMLDVELWGDVSRGLW
jgi:hypothetical protein